LRRRLQILLPALACQDNLSKPGLNFFLQKRLHVINIFPKRESNRVDAKTVEVCGSGHVSCKQLEAFLHGCAFVSVVIIEKLL
jgi:hypothetical protein